MYKTMTSVNHFKLILEKPVFFYIYENTGVYDINIRPTYVFHSTLIKFPYYCMLHM